MRWTNARDERIVPSMELYFSPLSCSLATRIALYEIGAEATFTEVDPKTKLTTTGNVDFRTIYPLGLVPTLRTDEGDLLTENAAILQWVAERFPDAHLAPTDPIGKARLRQWLCYVGTELHKALFVPLLDPKAPAEVKTYALAKASSRLGWVAKHLEGRETLLDRFSVADGYLFAVLNWATVTPVDLAAFPSLVAYMKGLHARASVARAFSEERGFYMQELERHKAS